MVRYNKCPSPSSGVTKEKVAAPSVDEPTPGADRTAIGRLKWPFDLSGGSRVLGSNGTTATAPRCQCEP